MLKLNKEKNNIYLSCSESKATPTGGPERKRVDERSEHLLRISINRIHGTSSRMTGCGQVDRSAPTFTGMTLVMVLALSFSTPIWAESCAGRAGTIVTGEDEVDYCESKQLMPNWWSAVAWCDGLGMELVSIDDCYGKNGDITGDVQCPNFTPKNRIWTKTLTPSRSVYFVRPEKSVSTVNITYVSCSALCKPKTNNN